MSVIIFDPDESSTGHGGGIVDLEPLQSAAEDYYERLYPLHPPEAENGYALRILCDALATPAQPVHEVVQDTDEFRPWEIVLDPDASPVEWLPLLELATGVVQVPADTELQRRARIRAASGLYAGTEQAIKDAVAATLTSGDSAMVRVVYPTQWEITVLSRTADTPDADASEAAALSQIPAGFILEYIVSDEPVIDEFTRPIDSITAVIDSLTLPDVT